MSVPTMPANTTPIEELERALEKARDRFAEYADSHQDKANEAGVMGGHAEFMSRCAKVTRNREMADLLDGVIADALPQLLSLAKLGLLVREGGEEVVEILTRVIRYPELSDRQARSAARAILRTLEGLVK